MRGTTGILEGKVVDKQTGQPLIAVNVVVVGAGLGAVTDAEGQYKIGNIRAGVYDIRFRIIGYKTVIMKSVTILPDLRTRLDVELEEAAIETEAIEVRAQRPLIQKDQAATVFSVGELKIEKLPVSKFQEILLLQPGTTMEGNVRGGKTTEIIFLVDGLPVQDVIGGGLGATLPKSSITGISIHTGGFEAEYGNAMSGVVNVITKSGGEHHRIGVRYERDNWLPERWYQQENRTTEIEATAGGPIVPGDLYYFTANSALTTDTRWWQDFQHFFLSPISQEFSGFAKVEYVVSPAVRLTGAGIYSIVDWRDYEFSWRFNLAGLPARSRHSYRAALTLSHTLSPSTFYTFTVSRFQVQSRIGEGSVNNISLEPYEYDFFLRYIIAGTRNWLADTRQTVLTFKADLTSEIFESHLFKIGAELNEYRIFSEVVKYEPQTTYFGKPIPGAPMLNYSNAYDYRPRSGSVFVQDKVELIKDGSNFSIGVRWDFLDPTAERPIVEFIPTSANDYQQVMRGTAKATFKHQVSPRISFAAPVGPSSFFFVNFGQYFQFPLFDYLYSGVNPVQLRQGVKNVQAGNPDLEPERTIAWEAGFKHGVNEYVVASATYFRKRFLNQIDTKTLIPFDSKYAGDFGFASYVNNAEANSSGFEFVLSRERDERLTGSVSYTYMLTEGISEYVDQALNYAQWGFPLAATPYPLSWDQRHSVKIDADFLIVGDIQANLVFIYNTARPYTFYPTRDGYRPQDSTKAFIPNNKRMFDVAFMNMKLSKVLTLGDRQPYSVTVYAHASNVLNKRNVRWMDSSSRIGGELGDPNAFYEPRRIRLGIRVEF
ncbi:MAG: carboxypeptidase-like regulatory domain-containing protein [Ignavibacteriales bacterium]|nr:carboxypeptidase-like regulatory domain-containing protein [Ignavibacteriales bacterium]